TDDFIAIDWVGSDTNVTVNNAGRIATDGAAVSVNVDNWEDVTGTFTLNNLETGAIDGDVAIYGLLAGSQLTVNNAGTMERVEVDNQDGSSTVVNNLSSGLMTTDTYGVIVRASNGNITVNNAGRIIAASDILGPDGEPAIYGGGAIHVGNGGN